MKELLELHPAMSYKVTNWSPAGLACPFPGYDGILGCSWMMSNHYPTALPAICRCCRCHRCHRAATALPAVVLPPLMPCCCQAAKLPTMPCSPSTAKLSTATNAALLSSCHCPPAATVLPPPPPLPLFPWSVLSLSLLLFLLPLPTLLLIDS